MNLFKSGAHSERPWPDFCHGVGDGHAGQSGALEERFASDCSHGVSCPGIRNGGGDNYIAGVFSTSGVSNFYFCFTGSVVINATYFKRVGKRW